MKTEQIILELMLELLNLAYMHRGDIGERNYLELSKKITDLYKDLKSLPQSKGEV